MVITSKVQNGTSCWIRRQQCPCGDKRCYIRFEDEKNEEALAVTSETDNAVDVYAPAPYVDQTFETDEEAFEYYSNFAKKNGFSVRRERSRNNPERGGIYSRRFVCHRSGVGRKTPLAERKRDRKQLVCGCEANMYVLKKNVGGIPRWFVRQFMNNHNHELLKDDQVRVLPAYREIPDADRKRILLLQKAGCSVAQIMKVLQEEKGEEGQLPFIERDVRNFLHSCKNIEKERDVSELHKVCKSVREKDKGFVYEYTVDENLKLGNIVWAYGDSIRVYKAFGDVVVFDASYREITYDRLLGVWLGIDNHGRTIIYGCVLLQDETPQSFTWAFQAFIRFMKGRCPETIITDIDLGIQDAVTSVMSSTKHVYCIRHILSKQWSWFSSTLGSRYEEFRSEFGRLYNLESTEDFESQWNQMVARFGLGSDEHICLLFHHRASWALPYLRGCFLAQMMTPEYSKSIDSLLKGIFDVGLHLEIFFEQIYTVADFRFGEQDNEDVHTKTNQKKKRKITHMKTPMPIEEHASSVLTPYAFNVLQNEIILSMQYAAIETNDGAYLVRHHKKTEGGSRVSWFAEDEKICCSCKLFEASGILCSHILRVLSLKNYFHIPETYLPMRWRQESTLMESDNKDGWSEEFHSLTSALLERSSITKERVNYVRAELTRILNHVDGMSESDEVSLNLEFSPLVLTSTGVNPEQQRREDI